MEEDIYIIIGKNIQKYRNEKKFTIKDLSIMTGLDINYLKSIEKNGVDKNITFDSLIKICNALEIKIINLFEKKEE